MKARIAFLDNLRTFAIFLVVVIHAGLVYERVLENIWIVSDTVKSDGIGLVRMYLDLIVMYTIFFISGYLVPYSVQKKSTTEFLVSKVKRILVPWLIAVLTLIPLYKMIYLFSRGWPQEAWYMYFHIFQRTGSDLSYYSNNPSQNWLWFLPVLFLFQVLYLVFHRMNLLPVRLSLGTGVILTIVIGVVYSMILSNAGLTGWHHSGFLEFQRERLLPYFMVFLLGTLCQKKQVFDTAKNTKAYIAANVVLTIGLGVFTAVALNLFFNIIEPGRNYFFISSIVDRTVYYFTALISMLSFLYILLHVFRFYLNKTNRIMNYLNRYSYSVYIIHVVVIGVLALALVNVPIPAVVKFPLLTIMAFAVSNFLVYVYDHVMQKNVYIRVAAASVFVIAFFAFTNTDSSAAVTTPPFEATINQQDVAPPSIGLHEAAIQGNVPAIRQHLRAGSDLNMAESSGGSSPLITAAVFGQTEVAKELINAGADVNFQNNDGSTPLITAAFFAHPEIVTMLLANRADPSIRNESGSTALDAVSAPFEEVRGVYDYFLQSLGPLGLKMNYEEIERDREVIERILRNAE